MPTPYNLEEEIMQWAETVSENAISPSGFPYKRINRNYTKDMLVILVTTLKECGVEKAAFYSSRLIEPITEACTGPKAARSKVGYRTGTRKAIAALKLAVMEVYGTEREHFKKYGQTHNIPTEIDKDSKIAKIIEEDNKAADDKVDLPRVTRTAENTVRQAQEEDEVEGMPDLPDIVKEFDPSKSDVAPANDIDDEELADILGYKTK